MTVRFTPDFTGWRHAARMVLQQGRSPGQVQWKDVEDLAEQGLALDFSAATDASELDLRLREDSGAALATEDKVRAVGRAAPGSDRVASHQGDAASTAPQPRPTPRVPPEFLRLAEQVAAHRSASRWALLYRMLWRLANGTPHLLSLLADDDVLLAQRMAKAVARDIHKMHAFVRFKVTTDGAFVAWHEPDHRIVQLAVPFFVRRFRNQRWSILTPEASAYWDLHTLSFGPGVPAAAAPQLDDQLEDLWCRYYAAVFNPARIKTRMMKSEMAVRYWQSLPETRQIPRLLAEAPERVAAMLALQEAPPVSTLVPPSGSGLEAIREATLKCRACPVCERTTQTVCGEGPSSAQVVVIGEQPGDEEDRLGRPFVGPAGQLLNEALAAAGIDRRQLYLTNAVKHFKHTPTPKRRLHQKPSHGDIAACKPWLEAELRELKPLAVVCLGASAAQAVLGRLVGIERERGLWHKTGWTPHTLVTRHPASILRAAPELKERLYAELVADLSLLHEIGLS